MLLKVIAGEEVAQQHQLLVCDMVVAIVKKVRKSFVAKRKVWRLKDKAVLVDF